MGILEIDQIKKCEQEAADLIEGARQRKKLAIEEAIREGEERMALRLSDAEKKVWEEREGAEKDMQEEHTLLLKNAKDEARRIREHSTQKKDDAVLRLIRMITGEDHVLSSPNE